MIIFIRKKEANLNGLIPLKNHKVNGKCQIIITIIIIIMALVLSHLTGEHFYTFKNANFLTV